MVKYFRILFVFLLVLLVFNGISDVHRGVYFKSKEVGIEERTGIDLTRHGEIPYEYNFSIEFDISFRDLTIRYGHIFQLKETEGGHQLDVICRDDDIFVVQDKQETRLHIRLSEEHRGLANRWVPFKLDINTISGKMHMVYDGQIVTDRSVFPEKSDLQWTFGIVNRYGFEIDEVAPVSIRNIRFSEQGNLKHHWPLNYSGESSTIDAVAGKAASIKNPAWVIEQHQKWQKIRTFEFAELPQVAFNRKSEEIYFIQHKQALKKYGLNTHIVSDISYNLGVPFFEDAQQAFFDKDNTLKVYSEFRNKVISFDEAAGSWNNSFDTLAYLPKYWHHNSLLHPVDSSYTTIGGYGFFTYFNLVKKLNVEESKWDTLSLKGDMFQPRYLSALGQSAEDKNVYYLFGGVGNESGKQILGKEFYYDLYRLDFEAGYVSKLWEWDSDNLNESYTPVNSMIIDKERACFYTLCFANGNSETALQLVKAQIDKPEFRFIGSKIPYVFSDVSSFADLFHWKTHNKLLAVTVHQIEEGRYEASLYTLNYVPSEEPLVSVDDVLSKSFPVGYLLIIPLVIVLVFILLVVYRKQRLKDAALMPAETTKTSAEPEESSDLVTGKILTFGGFKIFDKTEKDITYRFSPTLTELFLLILLNTIDGNKGISSKKIQEYLWPDKPAHKAKNNQGVNIKKLRAILEDVGDINVDFDGSSWRISYEREVFCDIDFIRKYYSEAYSTSDKNGLNKVISVLRRGKFVPDMKFEWLEKIKDEISGKIVARLEEVCETIDWQNGSKELLEITDVLFTFDQMNETALGYKCKILYKQGKHSLAKEVYDHFTKLYVSLYKEDFNVSFKELLKF